MAATIRRCGFCLLRRSFLRALPQSYCLSSRNTSSDNKNNDEGQDAKHTEGAVENKADVSAEESEHVKHATSMTPGEKALAGFGRAMEKAKHLDEADIDLIEETVGGPDESFTTMLRKSKLMQIGNPAGRIVLGTVVETVGDDLYIDFGAKFSCVCPRPNYLPEKFHRGTLVKLQLNDLEMTSSFLGSDKHVTLLEADATLIGLHKKPVEEKMATDSA